MTSAGLDMVRQCSRAVQCRQANRRTNREPHRMGALVNPGVAAGGYAVDSLGHV
jgi:hypothetical protein